MKHNLEELVNCSQLSPTFRRRLANYLKSKTCLNFMCMEMEITLYGLSILYQIIEDDRENKIKLLMFGFSRWIKNDILVNFIDLIKAKHNHWSYMYLSFKEIDNKGVNALKKLLEVLEAESIFLRCDKLTNDNAQVLIDILKNNNHLKEVKFESELNSTNTKISYDKVSVKKNFESQNLFFIHETDSRTKKLESQEYKELEI
ncbi:MAG: hypothetical protein ACK4PR_04705 [Gammaproteobacteria bacterium]